MQHDLYEQITDLSERAARSYSGRTDLDPAARWAAEAARLGRTLPINAATVQALMVAVSRFEATAGDAQARTR